MKHRAVVGVRALAVGLVIACGAHAADNILDLQKSVVVDPFQSAAKKPVTGLAAMTRTAVIAHAGFDFHDKRPLNWKSGLARTCETHGLVLVNASRSSSSERAELPEGAAKKLLEELTKHKE